MIGSAVVQLLITAEGRTRSTRLSSFFRKEFLIVRYRSDLFVLTIKNDAKHRQC